MEGGKEHHQLGVQLSNSNASARARQRHGSSELKGSDVIPGPSPAAAPPPRWKEALERALPKTKSSVSVSLEMLLLSAVAYGVLVFAAGKAFLPGGPAFAALLIWICSVVAAQIAHWLRIPRVVGMLGSGLLLANVPGGLVEAFPDKWGVQMRAAALATIFLRCGLELEFKTMALYKWPALRLAFLPGLAEAIFDAGIATAVFGMPFTLALSLGFILKAVGPGLVVPAMFQLQKQGWGAAKGIPSTVVIAASFDDIVAITGFSIFINIAIATGENAAWMIASGPLQVVFGMVGGIIAGYVLGCTAFLFNNKYKRLYGIYGAALLIMFFLEYFDMLSGGALGSLTVGLVTCYTWEHGQPAKLSLGPSQNFSADVERVMAVIWNWIMEPILFATIGTSIVFSELEPNTIPRALLVVCTGLGVRVVITYFIMGTRRYTWKEKLFYAVAWTPKATVQASLSAVPLALINQTMQGNPDYEQWVQWGEDCLATGIFAIVVCATLGTLLVFWLAPVLLEQEKPQEEPQPNMPRMSREASRTLLARQRSFGRDLQVTAGHMEPSSPDVTSLIQELRGLDDHNIINQYFDAIDKLVARVMEGQGAQAKDEGLCDAVLHLQDAITRDVGPREMTVRQMLHSAALRSRQPSITAAAADHLVRISLTAESPLEGLSSSMISGSSPRATQQGGLQPANGIPRVDLERGLPLESVGSTTGTGFRPAAAPTGEHSGGQDSAGMGR